MKHRFIKDSGASRLVVLFAGWGMDSKPFADLSTPAGYDLAVVWNYRNLDLDADLTRYSEICVVAWSYGVSMASIWLGRNRRLPVTRRVAVCGTLYPVDAERGIPEAVFRATLDNLTEASLQKFYQRMVGGRKAYEEFRSRMPERDIEGLKEELRSIEQHAAQNPEGESAAWDSVYVAEKDYIIPTSNQLKAWEGHPGLRVVEGSHYIDFKEIVSRPVCKEDVSRRFAASVATYDANATVQQRIAARLAEVWQSFGWAGGDGDVIEIGAGTGVFTREYIKSVTPKFLLLMDIAAIPDSLPGEKRVCDAETEMMRLESDSADAIVTASTVQWFNSPGRFLEECARVLRPGGVVVMSTFGPENYREISRYAGSAANYISGEMLRKIVPEGMTVEYMADEMESISFGGAKELAMHMKSTGVTGSGLADGARVAGIRGIIRENISEITYNPVYAVLKVSK